LFKVSSLYDCARTHITSEPFTIRNTAYSTNKRTNFEQVIRAAFVRTAQALANDHCMHLNDLIVVNMNTPSPPLMPLSVDDERHLNGGLHVMHKSSIWNSQNEQQSEMVYTDVCQNRYRYISNLHQQYTSRARHRQGRASGGHSPMPYVAGFGSTPVHDVPKSGAVSTLLQPQYKDEYKQLDDDIVMLCAACRVKTLQQPVLIEFGNVEHKCFCFEIFSFIFIFIFLFRF
jgi:hypothetical protein